MKRFITVLLTLAMLLSLGLLAACDGTEEQVSDAPTDGGGTVTDSATQDPNEVTDEMLDNSKPNEYIGEKLAAGREVLIGYVTIALDNDYTIGVEQGIRQMVEAEGYSFDSSVFGGDLSLGISQAENYLQMGAAALVLYLGNGGDFNAFAEQAMASGTYVITTASAPEYEVDAYQAYDHEAIGRHLGEVALAWVDQRYPDAGQGEIHAAFAEISMAIDLVNRFESCKSVLEADGRVSVEFRKDDINATVDSGYTFCEEALTYDPDIRIFICFTSAQALGCNNYVETQPEYDLADFASFGMDDNESAQQKIAEAEADPSVSMLRGFVTAGGYTTFDVLANTVLGVLDGTITPPYAAILPVYAQTSFGYTLDQRDA